MRIVHPPHDWNAPPSAPASTISGWLEIRRGSTRFPRRPLLSSRFLIGSGSNCHLQLGGEFPMLHSLLKETSDGWSIEAITPEPELLVNGTGCRSRQLQDGDEVQLGPFRFRFSLTAGGTPKSPRGRFPRIAVGS